jgi:hypothetical protein
MNNQYRLLVTGFLACGFLATACASGETVSPDGGTKKTGGSTGSGSGGTFGGGSGGTFGGGSGGTFGGGSGGTFVGAGGTLGGGGAVGSATPCMVAAADALIDDFEKPANGVMHVCVKGYWYTYNDGSAGTQMPIKDMFMNTAITDRSPSTYAAHSTATGFTGDTQTPKNIFAGFGLDFNSVSATSKATIDASAFKGITFYAKGSGTLNVRLPTPNSDPAFGCATKCYDTSKVSITLSAAWTKVDLTWDKFKQNTPPFGNVETITGAGLGAIQFTSEATAPAAFVPYDMWIDDLKFIP